MSNFGKKKGRVTFYVKKIARTENSEKKGRTKFTTIFLPNPSK